MDKDALIPISEFARLSGISRANLIYYDECGILKPEKVGRNKYRYYGIHQFEAAYLLLTLKTFGMSLSEIKDLAEKKTPGVIAEAFVERHERMERQIESLRQRLGAIQVYITTLRQAAEDRKAGDVIVRQLPAEPLVLGPAIRNFSKDKSNQYFIDFFNDTAVKGIPFGFPLGSMVDRAALRRGDWARARRLYFRAAESKTKKRAGLYAIRYSQGDFFDQGDSYERLNDFITREGYEIAGNAYEDYILDAILVSNPEDHLMRLSIEVRKK